MSNAELSAVLDDIPPVLGVPFLNLIFRRLAQWPELLIELWIETRPIVLTVEFAEAATRLANLAAPTEAVPGIARPSSITANEWARALLLTRAYRALQPQLLLLVAGWSMRASEDPETPTRATPVKLAPRPLPGRGNPTVDVPMVSAAPEDSTVSSLFEQMIVQRGHPGVASYYRSLAQWPLLLQAAWDRLQPRVSTDAYASQVQRLIIEATASASELQIQSVRTMASSGDDKLALRTLQAWRDVQIPQLMIDAALVETALSHATEAD